MFAVVAGRNGVGKTHLLEMMYAAGRKADEIAAKRTNFSQTRSPKTKRGFTSFSEWLTTTAEISPWSESATAPWLDGALHSGAVAFVASDWIAQGKNHSSNAADESKRRIQVVDKLIQEGKNETTRKQKGQSLSLSHKSSSIYFLHEYMKKHFGDSYFEKEKHEIVESIPLFALAESNPHPKSFSQELARVFVNYKVRRQQLIVSAFDCNRELDGGEIEKQIGPAPWRLANDLLAAAGFKYQLVSPLDSSLDSYELKVAEAGRPTHIQLDSLSTGEKTILGIVMAIFRAEHLEQRPKLLLMDEPDANLHSSQIRNLLDAIQQVLVGKYGCRTVLTTHRPETIAWAPKGSLFEMVGEPVLVKRQKSELYPDVPGITGETLVQERIKHVESPSLLISELTGNMLSVTQKRKVVLVEDQFDQTFWSSIYELITRYCGLESLPILVFQGTNPETTAGAGGCTAIKAVFKHLKDGEIRSTLCGLIDRDAPGSHDSESGIFMTTRYSIENYLFDPLLVYSLIVEQEKLSKFGLSGFYKPGDENRILASTQAELQELANQITSKVESQHPKLAKMHPGTFSIDFIGAKEFKLECPAWIRDSIGHSNDNSSGLTHFFTSVFDGGCNVHNLLKHLKRWRVFPAELKSVLIEILSS